MSDEVDTRVIDYRALVVSFAKALTAEEVFEVAFIWLSGKGDVSKYEPSRLPSVCGLELFASLERLRIFSRKNITGLVDIAKRLNRYDLVEKVETYKKKGGNYGVRYTKKKPLICSDERQQLEETFEVMVTQMSFLEQQLSLLQRTLQEKTDFDLLDEGMEIVHNSGNIVQDLASNLSKVHRKLARRSRADSNASGSSDGSSKRSSGEITATLSLADSETGFAVSTPQGFPAQTQQSAVSHRDKPVAKPRKPRSQYPPPYEAPIQESTGDMSQRLHPPMATVVGKKSHGSPPPVPPKTYSPKFNARHSGSHVRLSHPLSQTTVVEVATEEEDWTGDSGMGTGSGTAKYGTIDEWKDSMQNPPPERQERRYETLRKETTDQDLPYQEVDYN